MTSAALSAALGAVGDVRHYITISERRTDAIKQLLGLAPTLESPAAEWVRDVASFRDGRKFDYVCAVILLYGAFERFVEDAVEEYVTQLAQSTDRYSGLPEKLRSTHFTQVLSHLQRTRDARYDGRASAQQLVSAFANCLQDASPFEFVAESILHHTANFRPSVVDDYFGRVGIESASRRAVRSDVFALYVDASGRAIPEDRPEAVLDLVVDLVSRRNEVAHGVVPNTLGPSELAEYCDQVVAYCGGLAAVLDESLLAHLASSYGVEHGRPLAVYNHNVVCIQSKGTVITVGGHLAIQRSDGSWYSARIRSIQIDGSDVMSTPHGRDVAVGVAIEGRCKAAYSVRSGVLERVKAMPLSIAPASASANAPDAPHFAPEVQLWRARRDEALRWLRANGAGPNRSWLVSEYERCSMNLKVAEQAV